MTKRLILSLFNVLQAAVEESLPEMEPYDPMYKCGVSNGLHIAREFIEAVADEVDTEKAGPVSEPTLVINGSALSRIMNAANHGNGEE